MVKSVKRAMKGWMLGIWVGLLWGLTACQQTGPQVSDYDVIWDTPSAHAAGSMPVGNGEVGANVWVEANGDLLFYLARTDAWSETGRLLKLGRVRVSLSPNPFVSGQPFRQRLNLQEGRIDIEAGEGGRRVRLTLFADAETPVFYLLGSADFPLRITASAESWRTEPYDIPYEDSVAGLSTEWPRTGTYDDTQVVESADRWLSDPKAVVWCHRNDHSVYDLTLKHQQLEMAVNSIADPLQDRTFGVYMAGEAFDKRSETQLETPKTVRHFSLRLATATVQCADLKSWQTQVTQTWKEAPAGEKALKRTADYWKNYWEQSWIFIDTPGSDEGFRLTQAYLLQSWMTAAAGRGNYPLKFNGSIFTVDPQYTKADVQANPDYRMWGGHYWWQNTRLPYYPMLAGGHEEMMLPLFRHYQRLMPTFRTIAREYMGVPGAVIPETSSIFGLYRNQDYGWERQGLRRGEVKNGYIRHVWNGELELLSMMLDYYDYTGDTTFVKQTLLPVSQDVLAYFEHRFRPDEQGVRHIAPTQSLETYWDNVQDDLPCVAGLHTVLEGLLALPETLTGSARRQYWTEMAATLPPIPVQEVDGQRRFVPAGRFDPKTSNSEVPELYAIFPFWRTHVGTPDRQVGVDTYEARPFRGTNGWRQDGQIAALLGLTQEARNNVLAKIDNTCPGYRFPAMWGPNFDWTPDQDHGGNLMLTLQLMVLQSHGDTVYLLPAFPADWNVDFKLHVRGGGYVEGVYRDRRWTEKPTLVGGTRSLQLIEIAPEAVSVPEKGNGSGADTSSEGQTAGETGTMKSR